jgi:hypothetical protein
MSTDTIIEVSSNFSNGFFHPHTHGHSLKGKMVHVPDGLSNETQPAAPASLQIVSTGTDPALPVDRR